MQCTNCKTTGIKRKDIYCRKCGARFFSFDSLDFGKGFSFACKRNPPLGGKRKVIEDE